MIKTVILSLLVVVGFFGLFAIGSGKNAKSTGAEQPAISMQRVMSDVDSGGALLDVRTPEEFTASRIDGAENLPLQEMQTGIMPSVAKDRPIYVYCRSGSRSAQAASLLKAAGYQSVTDLGAMSDAQALINSDKS